MHSAPILIARVYRSGRKVGEVGYHGYATQRFGVCAYEWDYRLSTWANLAAHDALNCR